MVSTVRWGNSGNTVIPWVGEEIARCAGRGRVGAHVLVDDLTDKGPHSPQVLGME